MAIIFATATGKFDHIRFNGERDIGPMFLLIFPFNLRECRANYAIIHTL